MFCAISGEPPSEPVVSIKSGQLYEARLIKKYIDENGRDPITGDSLSLDDIVEVKANPRTAAPRPPTHSSIPSLLTSLQNEYDGLMMEMFTLKKNYDDVRQELAHALYANDAANRVVARLMGERDEARKALANISTSLGVAAPVVGEDAEMLDSAPQNGGLPLAAADIITSTAETLSSQRRAKMKRKAPQAYASSTSLPSFRQLSSLPSMHGTRPAGVSAMSLSHSGNLLITGGNDKVVQVYDRSAGKTVATLKGHTKRITRVVFTPPAVGTPDVGSDASVVGAPPYAVSASEDHTLRVWKLQVEAGTSSEEAPSYALAHVLKSYKAEVTGLDVHPSGLLIGSASKDGTWALHQVATGERLLVVDAPTNEDPAEADGGYAYESFKFHPDGQLAATGTAGGAIRVWDVKAVQKVSTFKQHDGAAGGVGALSFSENGYYLAAAARKSSEVKVWDLRKLSVAGTITTSTEEGASVSDVAFDPTAQLLAVVGTDVRVYANKTWKELFVDDANTAECTAVAWDRRDGAIVVASLDRTVRTLGTPPAA